ncbi:MAG: glucosaminidase domain-containing protein [Alphaproteobacteria bacterium]|nr:glucosaminidase domain-containing protein [Alphaproteobacteria bacterium]
MLQRSAPLIVSAFATTVVMLPLSPAHAVSLPAIKASSKNAVPECVTPGRLTSYLKNNNPRLKTKFKTIATEYMRHGERLGLRWDYAFFQMAVETGFLKFTGDVKPHQNNFAGLGATGGGVRGESFKTVASGVKAHLEHLLMYAGTRIENPTAERTRKIQEWKILAKWQGTFKRPMTFKDMARKWAPGSRGYPRDIEFVGERFFSSSCKQPDPQPELVLAARGGSGSKPKTNHTITTAKAKKATKSAKSRTASRADGRSALGAGKSKTAKADTANVKVLNTQAKAKAELPQGKSASASTAKKTTSKTKEFKTASIAGAAHQAATSANSQAKTSANQATCRVWSASYGGTKAVIIKAVDNKIVNYTVLKVNDGRVQPEAKAYIHAYAKGGSMVDKFANPDQALEKAFELCPEG